MSVLLHDRRWSLTVTQPSSAQAIVFASEVQQGYPLRINFAIERTLHSEANKGKFALTNLRRDHRANIAPGSLVIFRAGYGSLFDIIFRGTVAEISSSTSGTDVTTEIAAGDGEPYLQTGHVHLVYRGTTTLARVLQDISKRLNVTIAGQVFKYGDHVVQRIPRVTMGRRVFSGPVKQVLDDLLHPLQMTWSIQCGTLLIQNDNGIINLNAQVVSPTSGLLAVPSKTKSGVNIKTLLVPTVAPGLAVQVKSQDKMTSGNFRVVSAKYMGDTHGADWSIDADCQALTYPLANYVKETSQGPFEDAQQPAIDPEDVAEEGAE